MDREGFAGLITLPANAALSPPSTAGASRKWRPVGVDAGAERTMGREHPPQKPGAIPRSLRHGSLVVLRSCCRKTSCLKRFYFQVFSFAHYRSWIMETVVPPCCF